MNGNPRKWESIPWEEKDEQALVIHTLCIDPKAQGKGIGKSLLRFCEDYASKENYKYIRLDAFTGNPGALKLYVKHEYKRLGNVQFDSKPVGHQTYFCYEKQI